MLGLLVHTAIGAPAADLVTSLPGFNASWPFKVYSGCVGQFIPNRSFALLCGCATADMPSFWLSSDRAAT